MVAIVMRRSRSKPTPSLWQKERLLKSCRCCRVNKTVCDASQKSPHPCTYCSKRNLPCLIDAAKPANRDYDYTGEVVRSVKELHRQLALVVSRKERLLRKLVEKQSKEQSRQHLASLPVPSIDELQSAFFLPLLDLEGEKLFINKISTRSHADSFTIHSDLMSLPLTISYDRAKDVFQVFQQQYCDFLPVLPESFFLLDLHDIYQASDLLFWTIVVTAFISHGLEEEYRLLAAHVQNLVVVNCWFKTPRSLFALVALLILTLWPLPSRTSCNIQDNISSKYAFLMKSMVLQFGLHKLKFIDEFSKKTNIVIDANHNVNNIICERIYKFVNINSNYWFVYLGLSNSNCNEFHQDYIINTAACVDLLQKDPFPCRDKFINSLLKISLIQLKMNESMSDFIANPDKIGKLVHLHMFEQILTGYMAESSPLYKHDLISLSLEFSKLQLYVYYLSESDISTAEYKKVIERTVTCCQAVVDLFARQFGSRKVFESIPIHYRFSIELATLVLMQVHFSPLLPSVEHYIHTKTLFSRAYGLIDRGNRYVLHNSTKVLRTCIEKLDKCNRARFWALKSKRKNFFLIEKMAKCLVSASYYEILWQVYETEHHPGSDDVEIEWAVFGHDPEKQTSRDVIRYFTESTSILS